MAGSAKYSIGSVLHFRKMITPEVVRRLLDQKLGRPITDPEWAFLEENGTIGDAQAFGVDAEIVGLVTRARRAFGVAPEPKPVEMLEAGTKASSVSERVHALSFALACIANGDDRVQQFRTKFLANGLLGRDEVEAWIQNEVQAEGPQRAGLTIAMPDDAVVETDMQTGRMTVALRAMEVEVQRLSRDFLSYGVPGDDWERALPIARGGTLDRLRGVSTSLAARFQWNEAQATLFVLTGEVPLVSRVRARMTFSGAAPTSTARVVLEVDPTVPPTEVAKAYGRIRQRWLGARHRPLSGKHLRLATFYAPRPDGEPWKTSLSAWNDDAAPDERYELRHVANFARDCRKALDRLLDPPLDWRALVTDPPDESPDAPR